jgi:BspA type Leucine rich repeat region (6 copies)
MRKHSSIILVILLLLALPIAAPAQFNYTTNNGAITITGYTGSGGAVTIPDTINGLPVTSIGSDAFYYAPVTIVTIPNSVTSIAPVAFVGAAVTSVTIPGSVMSIGDSAFQDCGDLNNLVIGNGVTTIGDWAFGFCSSLTHVTIPDSVTIIGSSAFGSTALTSITIPGNIISFGDWAFANCTNLTHVTINSGVTTIGDGAFATTPLMSITIPSSVTTIGAYAFYQTALASVTIPSSVTTIGDYAFQYCYRLAHLTIGNGVTTIGINAFEYCSSLTNLAIPDSVRSIGDFAFFQTGLTTLMIGSGITSIGNEAFGYCDLPRIFFAGNAPHASPTAFAYYDSYEGNWQYDSGTVFYLPSTTGWSSTFANLPTSTWDQQSQCSYISTNGVVIITSYVGSGGAVSIPAAIGGLPVVGVGGGAFANGSGVTSVTIPNSVTSIGESAFYYCYNLSSVTIGNGVTNIGDYAFYDTAVANVTIPNSVISLGSGAFEECSSLTNVTIGNSLTTIGEDAFDGCGSLIDITVDNADAFYSSLNGVLLDKNQTTLIVFPPGRRGDYTIPNSVTGIGSGAFENGRLTGVTIPNSVISIGDSAFQSCSSLTNVTLGNGITSIGVSAFSGCSSLASAAIPNSVTGIGDDAFEDCYRLTSVTIGNGITSIGSNALAGCQSLAVVYFGGNAPIADDSLFDGDPATVYYLVNTTGWSNTFASVPTVQLEGPPQPGTTADGWKYLSDQLTIAIITGYAGSSRTGVIPSLINGLPVTAIGRRALENLTNLNSVTIPDSVTSIGDYAFANDAYPFYPFSVSSLTNVTIGNSVTSIGEDAFFGCSKLTNVTIPNSVTTIGDQAFENCNSLTSVYFSGDAPSVGQDAFSVQGIKGGPRLENATVYYLSGTTGWSNVFAGLPTVMLDGPPQFGTTADGWNYVSDQVKNTLITGYAGFNNSVVIPSIINGLPVNGIGPYTFLNESSLASVTIPDSITSIGYVAFDGCYSLTNVMIGNGVTNIGVGAFQGCSSLTVIAVAAQNPAYSSSNGVLFDENQTTLIQYPGGNTATSYMIPNTVTSIGDDAFENCYNLTNVIIGNGVTSIGSGAFEGTALTSVTIPNSVTNIGSYAFANDDNLTSVTIPNSVTNIGDEAFEGCESLTSVYFGGDAPDPSVFDNDYGPTVYYLPGTLGWDDFSANTGLPTALWLPQVQTGDGNFGVKNHQFGFNIAWASGQTVVVEACTNLTNPVWLPVSTNTLVGGTSHFSDPQPASLPGRFYRAVSQ